MCEIPRPRRFSIRLPRPLWIGVAAAILIVAAIGLRIGIPAWRQQAAIHEIERLEGNAETKPAGPMWPRGRLGDEWMKVFDEVVGVSLVGTAATDATLREIRGLTSLESLDLSNTQVTDAGLAHLMGLTRLEELILGDTSVNGAGLAHLNGLTNLKNLELDNTQMNDAGMAHLKGLPNLESLWIDNTQVTDAGLVHLQGLTRLRLLWLDRTRASEAGVLELRRAMPGLVVYYHKSLL